MKDKIIEGVNEYYSSKIGEYGHDSKGVDWNSKESQYVRFGQLSKVIKTEGAYSILDFGCGYGELVNFLHQNPELNAPKSYCGYDISASMIEMAQKLYGHHKYAQFTTECPDISAPFDFSIASGLFNVRLNLATDEEWMAYILKTLQFLNQISNHGFAINALTKYSDKEYMKDYLYYADPLILFDYCKRNFSKDIALLHDYGLYEFTLIIRK